MDTIMLSGKKLILLLSLAANLISLTVASLYVINQGGLRYLQQKAGLLPVARHIDSALYLGRRDTLRMLPPAHERWVFLGDSMTDYAPLSELFTQPMANRGLASDQVADMATRLDSLQGSRPAGIVVWAGINDLLAQRSCAQVAEDVTQLAVQLRQRFPKTPVAVLEITSLAHVAGRNPETINAAVRCTNERLKISLAGHGLPLIALAPAMNENDRLRDIYTADGIHLNGHGYLAWAQQIAPALGLTARPAPAAVQ